MHPPLHAHALLFILQVLIGSRIIQRLSTLAVTVAIPGLHIPGFSILDFERAAVVTFSTLLPAVQDTALLSLLEQFFQEQTTLLVSSNPTSASFAAIGQSL